MCIIEMKYSFIKIFRLFCSLLFIRFRLELLKLCFQIRVVDSRQFISVQSLSRVQLSATQLTAELPGYPFHPQLLELAQTHVH